VNHYGALKLEMQQLQTGKEKNSTVLFLINKFYNKSSLKVILQLG
jgi:hypothetical protein